MKAYIVSKENYDCSEVVAAFDSHRKAENFIAESIKHINQRAEEGWCVIEVELNPEPIRDDRVPRWRMDMLPDGKIRNKKYIGVWDDTPTKTEIVEMQGQPVGRMIPTETGFRTEILTYEKIEAVRVTVSAETEEEAVELAKKAAREVK